MTLERILFAVVIAGLAALLLLPKCKPEPVPVTPAKSEQKRQTLQTQDKIDHAVYVADTLRRFNENKALRERLTIANDKVTDLKEKARQSAAEHAKSPSLATCQHALKDCQEHAAALTDVVSIQDVQLTGYEADQRKDRNEIARIQALKDSAFAGWGDAVVGWQKTEQELEKAKRPKRIGIGLNLGYGATEHGLTPYIGIGASYNIIRL